VFKIANAYPPKHRLAFCIQLQIQAIGNFLRLLADLPNTIAFDILNLTTGPLYNYLNNGIVRSLVAVQHTHNLALAINRAHGMFFPFHYNMVYAKKK
jgi:hypothetical protein